MLLIALLRAGPARISSSSSLAMSASTTATRLTSLRSSLTCLASTRCVRLLSIIPHANLPSIVAGSPILQHLRHPPSPHSSRQHSQDPPTRSRPGPHQPRSQPRASRGRMEQSRSPSLLRWRSPRRCVRFLFPPSDLSNIPVLQALPPNTLQATTSFNPLPPSSPSSPSLLSLTNASSTCRPHQEARRPT